MFEMTEQTSLKLVSSALSTVQSYSKINESIKKALTLILSSYLASKTILPVSITNKITDLEDYVAAVDKTAIVASLDNLADAAIKAKKVKNILYLFESYNYVYLNSIPSIYTSSNLIFLKFKFSFILFFF